MNPLAQLPPELAKIDQDDRVNWAKACACALIQVMSTDGLRRLLATGRTHVKNELRKGFSGHDLRDDDFEIAYQFLVAYVRGQRGPVSLT